MSKLSQKNGHGLKSAAIAWLPARCLLIFCASALCVNAEEFEQHHAHEHGKVTLNVAIDESTLVVELDAPAINVVGFEHAPRNRPRSTFRPGAGCWAFLPPRIATFYAPN